MASEPWQNELQYGDAVEADHPSEGRRVQGTFTYWVNSRHCEIKYENGMCIVACRGLIRRESDDETT